MSFNLYFISYAKINSKCITDLNVKHRSIKLLGKKHRENLCDLGLSKEFLGGFPGGAVVKNLPANARDMGSSPGPGRSHMPRSNQAREPQLLSPRATTTEACMPRAHAPKQEKPPQ